VLRSDELSDMGIAAIDRVGLAISRNSAKRKIGPAQS